MVLLAKNSISLFRSQFGALAPAFREAMNRGVNDIPRGCVKEKLQKPLLINPTSAKYLLPVVRIFPPRISPRINPRMRLRNSEPGFWLLCATFHPLVVCSNAHAHVLWLVKRHLNILSLGYSCPKEQCDGETLPGREPNFKGRFASSRKLAQTHSPRHRIDGTETVFWVHELGWVSCKVKRD